MLAILAVRLQGQGRSALRSAGKNHGKLRVRNAGSDSQSGIRKVAFVRMSVLCLQLGSRESNVNGAAMNADTVVKSLKLGFVATSADIKR